MTPSINNYDVILSIGSLAGVLISLLQAMTGPLIKPKHITLDIALPRLLASHHKSITSFARYAFASLEKIICYSTMQKHFWNTQLNGTGRTAFIPIGIDLTTLTPTNAARKEYISCAGRAGRDYVTLFAALTGKDPIPTQQTHSPLRALASLPHVTLQEEVPYEQYQTLMTHAKVIVLPLEESVSGFGQVVLLEAMALGKTIIVSKVNGTADYIQDTQTGYFVPPGNAEALREKIEYVFNNYPEASQTGTAATQAAQTYYSEQTMTAHCVSIINSITNPTTLKKEPS